MKGAHGKLVQIHERGPIDRGFACEDGTALIPPCYHEVGEAAVEARPKCGCHLPPKGALEKRLQGRSVYVR